MTKRGFYEDDEQVVTKPGYETAIDAKLEEQEGLHGNVSFIQGMSIRSAPYLEKFANSARLWTHDKVSVASAELETQKSAFNNEVGNLKSEIDSLIKEPVLPNSLYILTGTLAGSILSARRGFLVRFLTPVAFGVASLSYFAPKTFEEISAKVASYEKEHVPEVYNAEIQAADTISQWRKESENQYIELQKSLTKNVGVVRKYIVDLFD